MKNWWKIACVVLLLYVVVYSFLCPLGPGMIGVDKQTLEAGINQFTALGYNTRFVSAASSMNVVLELDSNHKFCCDVVETPSEDKVVLEVEIPDTVTSTIAAVYINNNEDGTIYFPNAVSLRNVEVVSATTATDCMVNITTENTTHPGYPFQPTIFETIRNLMFHVPMWFTMFYLMIMSFVFSLKYLRNGMLLYDLKASVFAKTGMLFCILGLITGSIWARFTWGAWWVRDPQLNGALVVFLIYAAYMVLRRSLNDDDKRARLSAIYNIFAFVMMVILLMVLPRFTESLHPGKSGTPAFSSYDLDSSLRMVFYPAVIGWILLGHWIYSLRWRLSLLSENVQLNELKPSVTLDKI